MRAIAVFGLLAACAERKDPYDDDEPISGDDDDDDDDDDGDDDDDDGDCAEEDEELWYADLDGDGFGDPDAEVSACEAPEDHVSDDGDCDDGDDGVHPDAAERCNGVDDDCDQATDDDAQDSETFYADSDGDGYGDPADAAQACEAPADHVDNAGDCDDSSAAISPETVWYADLDWDGYGDASASTAACNQPSGYVADDTDCDDSSGAVRPGGLELCDGLDNDCDLAVDDPACDTFVGTYTGTYGLLTQELLGGSVINSMSCGEPSSLSITIDLDASPVVTGTASCTYGGSLGGFYDEQQASFELSLTPDGLLTGYVGHEFDSSYPDWFDMEGSVGGGALTLLGSGLYYPSSYSVVGWETDIEVEATQP